MLSLNNVATADTYQASATLESHRGGGRVVLLVANASVYVQVRPLFDPASAAAEYGPEFLVTPTTGGFRACSGIRFRSAIAGSPARIICQMYEPGDVEGDPGTSFTETLQASGGTITPSVIPAGTILGYGGAAAPAGFVLCDGSTYDGTLAAYASLFAVIGLTYGGAGSNFQVPDYRGRTMVGLGTNADVNARAKSDGVAVANRSPRHNHTVGDSGHTHPNPVMTASTPGTSVIDGRGGVHNTDYASGSATTGITVGPGGTLPVDAPGYLVANYIISLG